MIGGIFSRLHSNYSSHPPKEDELRRAVASAKLTVAHEVERGFMEDTMSVAVVGSWLQVAPRGSREAYERHSGLTMTNIPLCMQGWLNCIVMQVPPNPQTLSTIKYCLSSIGVHRKCKDAHQFKLGHRFVRLLCLRHSTCELTSARAFYSLLGTKFGHDVTWLLAKRKSRKILDLKAISAITIVFPDEPEGLTEEEHERFLHPTLFFKVSKVADELRKEHRDLEWYCSKMRAE
jgi:hypothetical protein